MKKSRKALEIAAVSVLLVFFLAGVSNGETAEPPNNYLQGHLGVFEPIDDLDDSKFETGFFGALSYGRHLSENFIIEGTLDYTYSDRDLRINHPIRGAYKQEEDLYVSSFSVTVKGELPLGPVDLFAGAGVGIYGAWLYADIDDHDRGRDDGDDFDTAFGVHLVVGANYNITNYIFVGIEGLYRWTDEVDVWDRMDGIYTMEYDGNLNGYIFCITAGMRF